MFKAPYAYRNGQKYFFMTMFSNAIEEMKLNSGLSKNACLVMLHIYSFKYFKTSAIKMTSHYKMTDALVSNLVKEGFLRVIVKAVIGESSAVYSISPKGEYLCDEFYRTLLNVKTDGLTRKKTTP